MAKIHVLPNSDLTENVVNLLNKQRIIKIRTFFETDFRKLAKISNLSIKSIWDIKSKLRTIYGCQTYAMPTLDSLRKEKQTTTKYTNIQSLDSLLQAAGVTDHNFVVELCGEPNVGKSLCCQTIAINQAIDNLGVLYIDTKLDFNPMLIENMLRERQLGSQMRQIMSRILVERAYSLKSVFGILKKLEKFQGKFIQLVIIDSLSAIWYLKSERSTIKAYARLKSIGQLVKKLNDVYGLKFILTNLSLAIEDTDERKPAMGYVWCRVPKLRIFLVQQNDMYFFKLQKNNHTVERKSSQVRLSNKGFY